MIKSKDRRSQLFIAAIVFLALMSSGRILSFHDVIWDDNCWVLSSYFTNNLDHFLATGFYELRRFTLGTFLYYFFSLHKLSDHAFLIWNSLDLTIQVLSPLVLYAFMCNLFKSRLLAFFASASFTICLLDNTLPYYTSVTYRLGTLACIVSFYLTERAMTKESPWLFLFLAMMVSAFSSYVLMETTIAVEPARFFLILYLIRREETGWVNAIKKGLSLWLPFIAIILPLIAYKLMVKPYGIYASIYPIDPLFFLNFKLHAKLIRHFMFYNWFQLLGILNNTSIWSALSGTVATAASFWFIRYISVSASGQSSAGASVSTVFACMREKKYVAATGLLLIIPAVFMYEFAGRVPAPGMEGRHATILLFGFSILLGYVMYCLYSASAGKKSMRRGVCAGIIIFFGAGVFFSNANLDLYLSGQKYQKQFWKAFTKRFPSLPDKAEFLMDVRGPDFFNYYADLEAYYELELLLNMLYARSRVPDEFLNYRVYAISEGIKDEWKGSGDIIFQRYSHTGKDTFNTKEMIFVFYGGGEISVNREILQRHPDVPYKMWLDKDPPEFSGAVPDYPLRYKFQGFY